MSAKRQKRSPRISGLAWGRLDVEGFGSFRNAKLYPGGAREWDWAETGTEHDPGIQPADIAELIDHGAATVVLSQGVYGRLGICPDTLDLLARKGVRVHVLRTREAVDLYNALTDTDDVGGLFHTTC